MKEDPDLLHMDRTEFHLNRIMKRQGAKPPWIELQNGQFRCPSASRDILPNVSVV